MNPGFGECFSCPLGVEVMLRVDNSDVQLKSSLVGLDRGNFLILKTPKAPEVKAALKIQKPVKAVFIHDGTIFGFVSRVIHAVDLPEPLYFLAFPEAMERRELRKDRRIECHIPGSVRKDQKSDYPCVVKNLSSGGCGITISNTSRQLPADVKIESLLELSCEMLGIPYDKPIRGFVKNVSQTTRKMHIGFQFDTADADILERIQSYVDRVLNVIS